MVKTEVKDAQVTNLHKADTTEYISIKCLNKKGAKVHILVFCSSINEYSYHANYCT